MCFLCDNTAMVNLHKQKERSWFFRDTLVTQPPRYCLQLQEANLDVTKQKTDHFLSVGITTCDQSTPSGRFYHMGYVKSLDCTLPTWHSDYPEKFHLRKATDHVATQTEGELLTLWHCWFCWDNSCITWKQSQKRAEIISTWSDSNNLNILVITCQVKVIIGHRKSEHKYHFLFLNLGPFGPLGPLRDRDG